MTALIICFPCSSEQHERCFLMGKETATLNEGWKCQCAIDDHLFLPSEIHRFDLSSIEGIGYYLGQQKTTLAD